MEGGSDLFRIVVAERLSTSCVYRVVFVCIVGV